jgi:hypothetical protein
MSYSNVSAMLGVNVSIQIDRPDPETRQDFTVLEGRILRVEQRDFAIKTQFKTWIIPLAELLEIERLEGRRRALTVRYLRVFEAGEVRQHLLDRHGLAHDLLTNVDQEVAMELHNRIDHSHLGHRHEPRPSRRATTANGSVNEPTESD